MQRRRFRCGNSAQFQGDERDVIFLSVVDVPGTGPLSRRSEDLYKKRYNVAASRARDQMWVIYSLDPHTDLQTGDLRRELITFALDPKANERIYNEKVPATESDFEEKVLRRLIDAGFFMIEPQYWVGAYRLDFAIRQHALRIAIECDGERFHGSDKLDEDLARQATLERLGWRFIRIRGSEFYRDEIGTITRTIHSLEEFGVDKTAVVPGDNLMESNELLDRIKFRVCELLTSGEGSKEEEKDPPLARRLENIPDPGYSSSRNDKSIEFDEPARPVSTNEVFEDQNDPGISSRSIDSLPHNIQLELYLEFQGLGLPDPKVASIPEIAKAIVDIVKVEGPVTLRTVFDRYRTITGCARFKGPTRDKLIEAIRFALSNGSLCSLALDADPLGEVVALPQTPSIRVRERGPRNLEDIPVEEIRALANNLKLDQGDETVAFRQLLAAYGLKRLTEGALERLQSALRKSPTESSDN